MQEFHDDMGLEAKREIAPNLMDVEPSEEYLEESTEPEIRTIRVSMPSRLTGSPNKDIGETDVGTAAPQRDLESDEQRIFPAVEG